MKRLLPLVALACLTCLRLGGQDAAVPNVLKVANPADPTKSVDLKPLATFTFSDRRPVTLKPAGGGRALVGQHPFSKRLSVWRLDRPEFLGQVAARGDGNHFTANLHSLYVFDDATKRITRYPLGSLRADRSFQMDMETRGQVRITTGPNGVDAPVFVTGTNEFLMLHPKTMLKLGFDLQFHPPRESRPPTSPRFSEGTVSPDGTILVASSQIAWLGPFSLNVFNVNAPAGSNAWWLSHDGRYRVHDDRYIPLGEPNAPTESGRNLRLIPGISSPLAYAMPYAAGVKPGATLRIFAQQGQVPVLDLGAPAGTIPFISFAHRRLALVTHQPEQLVVYEFDAAALAASLEVPPWVEIRGPSLVRQGHQVRLELVPAYGSPTSLDLIRCPPGASLEGRFIKWTSPAVYRPAGFQFVVGFETASGKEGRAFADLLVTPDPTPSNSGREGPFSPTLKRQFPNN